jgi:hypothetical protein
MSPTTPENAKKPSTVRSSAHQAAQQRREINEDGELTAGLQQRHCEDR